MLHDELEKQIRSLNPWYQKITIEGITTSEEGSPYAKMENSGLTWQKIDSLIPDFKNKKIIDLGCNAGYYSIRSAQNGASVVGVETTPIFFKQALWLKEYYEKECGKELDITYINADISHVDFESIGKVDYIFAFSILYHIGKFEYDKNSKEQLDEQERMMKILTDLTDNFLVRVRKEENKNVEYYDSVFVKYGFERVAHIPEGKRAFVVYSRNLK
jgi:SAM-dependent methyltransferase